MSPDIPYPEPSLHCCKHLPTSSLDLHCGMSYGLTVLMSSTLFNICPQILSELSECLLISNGLISDGKVTEPFEEKTVVRNIFFDGISKVARMVLPDLT